MFTKKLENQFSADLLNTVRGVLDEAEHNKECGRKKCEDKKDEMKEGYVPTADEPTEANKKTADKVRALLAKEKKPVEEEKHGIPFKGPYKKVGDRKDEYGNVIKNVAKHLAKKAMNAQKNEELEHTNCGTPDCCGECDTVNQIDEAINFTAHDAIAKGHDGKTYTDIFNAHGSSIHNKIRAVRKERDENPNSKHARFLHTRMLGAYAAWYKNKKAVKEEAEQIDEATAKIVAHLQKRYGDNIRKSHVRSAANDFGVDASKLAKAVRTKLGKTSLAEEVEQVDEISAKTAVNAYAKRNAKAFNDGKYDDEAEKDYNKLDKQGDRIQKKFGNKIVQKAQKAASKKIFGEEVEELDEVSKATLGRYINKAKDSIDTASYRQGHKEAHGSSSKPLEKKLTKRHKGISTAVSKLTKEEEDFVDSLNNEIFEKTDPYDIAGMIKKAKAKNDPNHPAMKHVAAIEDIKKHGGALSVQGDHVRSLIKALGEEVQMEEDDGWYTHSQMHGSKRSEKHPKGISAAEWKSGVRWDHRNNKRINMKKEQIEEGEEKGGGYDGFVMPKGLQDRSPRGSSRGAMGRAIEKQQRNLARARMDRAARGEINKEEADYLEKDLEIKEGRGRPPKEGSPAWHAKQKQASDDMVALGMQLRKSRSINKKVRFMDNKEHEISLNHINRFDDHMAARRTSQEKDNFQRQAHKSHAEFVKAVSAPVPKVSKDTGEIVRYRH